MIILKNYVLDDEIYEDILKRIYFHTCIEFKLDHSLYPYIVENYGKFDNVGLVVKHIINELEDHFESQVIDCTNDKVYFKYIDIQLDKNQNGLASYIEYKDHTVFIKLFANLHMILSTILIHMSKQLFMNYYMDMKIIIE